ncbi:MAG: MFS transporter [Methylophilus sp.]|uniref:MFS transporter n=1 Tax=Methylophilus sp. TaxID=29541 RepID=UPI003FA04993
MHKQQSVWPIIIAAAAILAVTMGIRQSLGLFVSPLNSSTGLGIVTISFAMAIAQFAWGLAQPLFGMLADRVGSFKVIVIGTLLMAAGLAVTPFVSSEFGLVFSIGILTAVGAGAGSFSILIGAVAARLPAERRSFAAGFINAGGSFGQFIFAPMAQALIHSFNWINALLILAFTSLSSIFLALPLRKNQSAIAPNAAKAPETITLRQQIRIAFKDRSYLCLHAGFFTCGFHIAFLVTHLPGEVNICGLAPAVGATSLAIIGLANVVGSLYAGWLGQTRRMKMILFWMYASRAVAVGIYLAAPKTEWTFYVFAAVLGFTWLSTVPPTAGLVGKLFGPRYLATLFGLTLLSHQIGGFFGAWLGGLVFYANGDYQWMWVGDMVLATLAAVVNLPIREAKPGAE